MFALRLVFVYSLSRCVVVMRVFFACPFFVVEMRCYDVCLCFAFFFIVLSCVVVVTVCVLLLFVCGGVLLCCVFFCVCGHVLL